MLRRDEYTDWARRFDELKCDLMMQPDEKEKRMDIMIADME